MQIVHGLKRGENYFEMQELKIDVSTLGQALAAIEHSFHVKIIPVLDLDRYFTCIDIKTRDEVTTDIHIYRNGETICPKQDLSFEILDDDEVFFGEEEC